MASPTLHVSPQFDDEEYFEESEVFAVNAGRHLQELQRLSAFQQVTTTVPPAYDGRTSWVAYEDAIDDWVDITELEPEKQGPALRNRLEGEAAIHKRLLDRDRLKTRSMEFGLQVPYPFVKGLPTFSCTLPAFMTLHRGNGDMLRWITRFQNAGGMGRHLCADHRTESSRSSCLRCLPVTRGPSDDHCRGSCSTGQRETEEAACANHPITVTWCLDFVFWQISHKINGKFSPLLWPIVIVL